MCRDSILPFWIQVPMTVMTPKSRAESHNQLAIQQALSLCLRHQHPVTLLALDVAEFDNLRADIGESRLEELVSVMADHLQQFKRCEDLLVINPVSHHMLVVLPATDIHGGHQLAQRLLDRFGNDEIQLDDFQVEVSIRIALHGRDVLDSSDPSPLIESTLELLERAQGDQQLVLSPFAMNALKSPAIAPSDQLAANLLAQASRKQDNSLLDTLKPALSRLPESERMKLVDHLLDLSTRLESGFARQ